MCLKLAFSLFALVGSLAFGYNDNCKGSSRDPSLGDCQIGISTKVHPDGMYSDGFHFSYRSCFLAYRSGGDADYPVSGKVLMETATRIISECKDEKNRGSYGTGNCEECHVTVNFLSNCHQSAPLTCITGMYHNKNEEDAPKFTDFPEPEGEEEKRSSGLRIEPPPPSPLKGVEFAA